MRYIADRGFKHPVPSEITPQRVYQQRREALRWMATGAAGAVMAGWAGRHAMAQYAFTPGPGKLDALEVIAAQTLGGRTDEKLTSYEDITGYNNFYEFGLDKADPARNAHRLPVRPWTVAVEGEVGKPRSFDIEELLKLAPMEERIYRMRCVEGWSMVIPWVGFPLSALINQVQPTGNAKYVSFETLADRQIMPGLRSSVLEWPYIEGLRMDEAMHPLTLLTFGLYGEVLPKQNGAPVRMVVPWKYGFKSGKSIVRIRFTEEQPRTSWLKAAPQEYGFYSNVNPRVNHPRWSQATERRIGEDGLLTRRRPTQMFNGYAEQVGQLYAGMDLRKNY